MTKKKVEHQTGSFKLPPAARVAIIGFSLLALGSEGVLAHGPRPRGDRAAAPVSAPPSTDAVGPIEPAGRLSRRAYVVCHDSPELFVINLDTMTVIAQVDTAGIANHMVETNVDFTKVYVSSSDTNELVVVDARTLQVTKRLTLGLHPAHISRSADGSLLTVVDEDDNSVSFISTATDTEVKRLPGFFTPHFVRHAADNRYAYVANFTAYHLTIVDMATLTIAGTIPLAGIHPTPPPGEFGFADAQIASDGLLYAAHAQAGKVIVYDTINLQKVTEIKVGQSPWIAYAEHSFGNVPARYLVPNFDDQTVSLIDGIVVTGTLPGDEEAYGVNYTSRAPNKAFVMNRVRQDIAVVNTATGQITSRIPVGGNTETASTTPDGKYVIATVSGANKVVVIDAVTNQVVKSFTGMGAYPWAITVPLGQNYCH